MSTDLRARIVAAIEAGGLDWAEIALMVAVLAELDTLKQDLDDQRDEHMRAEALRAELARVTSERDKLDKDNDIIRDECRRVMAERDTMRAAIDDVIRRAGLLAAPKPEGT